MVDTEGGMDGRNPRLQVFVPYWDHCPKTGGPRAIGAETLPCSVSFLSINVDELGSGPYADLEHLRNWTQKFGILNPKLR